MIVVYFDQLSGAFITWKLVETFFFSRFSTFFVHFKAFSVISPLKSTKNVWKWTKKRVFVYSSKLVDMQKLADSLRGYLEFVFFGWFFTENALKWTKKVEKWLKKRFRPAFRCWKHLKVGRNTQHMMLWQIEIIM